MKLIYLTSSKQLEVESPGLIATAAPAQPPKAAATPKPAPLVMDQGSVIWVIGIVGSLVSVIFNRAIAGLKESVVKLQNRGDRLEQHVSDQQSLILREYVSKSDLAGTVESLNHSIEKLDTKLESISQDVTAALRRCSNQ